MESTENKREKQEVTTIRKKINNKLRLEADPLL